MTDHNPVLEPHTNGLSLTCGCGWVHVFDEPVTPRAVGQLMAEHFVQVGVKDWTDPWTEGTPDQLGYESITADQMFDGLTLKAAMVETPIGIYGALVFDFMQSAKRDSPPVRLTFVGSDATLRQTKLIVRDAVNRIHNLLEGKR